MACPLSVGDFIAVGTLIKDICHCLNSSRGSAAEYQELVRELESLKRVLCHIDKLQNSSLPSVDIASIKYAALSCRYPLEQFLQKIQKYDASLGVWKKDGVVKSTAKKLRWAYNEKDDIIKLQSYLNFHIGTINILLAEYGLEKLIFESDKAAANHLDIQARLHETHTIVQQCNSSLAAQSMAVWSTQQTLSRLCNMISGDFATSWHVLQQMIAKVCVSTQQIYTLLIEIRTSLPGADARWTYFQAPLLVEDALGRKFPVPSEYDFDLLDAVIKQKFSTGLGSTQVQAGDYEYFKAKNSSAIISQKSQLLPGMAITMAIIVNRFLIKDEICPATDCSSLNTIDASGGGRMCCECHVWYSITERRAKSLKDILVSKSALQSISVLEDQSDSTNPREVTIPLVAEENESMFRNIRLSSASAAPKFDELSIEIHDQPDHLVLDSPPHPHSNSQTLNEISDHFPCNTDSPEERESVPSKAVSVKTLSEATVTRTEVTTRTYHSGCGHVVCYYCKTSGSGSGTGHQRYWYCCHCDSGPHSLSFQRRC